MKFRKLSAFIAWKPLKQTFKLLSHRQFYNGFVHKKTHKDKQLYKYRREEHVKITNK